MRQKPLLFFFLFVIFGRGEVNLVGNIKLRMDRQGAATMNQATCQLA